MKRIRFFDEDFPAHFGMTIDYEKGRNPENKYGWIGCVSVESEEE